jgi:alkaline phosphatase
MKKKSFVTLPACLFIMLNIAGCNPAGENLQNDQEQRPSNIIFLIGDGMGLSAVTAGFYFSDEPSQFNRFRHIGLNSTSSTTHKVTDSAASGTALATGNKTYNGAIGLDTTRTPVRNICEIVSALGWSTGVVSTSSVTHATPASFYAHVERRNLEEQIAEQLIGSDIDFFAGGGIRFFDKRSDGRNLFEEAKNNEISMDTTRLPETLDFKENARYGYLLAGTGMPPKHEGRGDFLPEATGLAIRFLSGDADGFFLMVESSQIDWAGHDNDQEYLVAEMLDFEQVIKKALDFAGKDGNTLVVVTADHETGGATLVAGSGEEPGNPAAVHYAFATGSHSATLIPVFAFGPGAEQFMGIYENTEIFRKMAALVETDE